MTILWRNYAGDDYRTDGMVPTFVLQKEDLVQYTDENAIRDYVSARFNDIARFNGNYDVLCSGMIYSWTYSNGDRRFTFQRESFR